MSSIRSKVGLAVAFAEFDQVIVLNRVDEVVDENSLERYITLLPFFLPDVLADGLHQVGLAETDSAVNEERIVGARR